MKTLRALLVSSCTLLSWQIAKAEVACNDASFLSSIGGGFLSNSPFVRLNKTPATFSAFKRHDSVVDHGRLPSPFYTYTAQFNNIKHWRAKVCARQMPGYSAHNPYRLEVAFLKQGPFGWETMKSNGKESSWHIPVNETRVYTWAWNTNEPANYRIEIRGAEANDQFDIMMDK